MKDCDLSKKSAFLRREKQMMCWSLLSGAGFSAPQHLQGYGPLNLEAGGEVIGTGIVTTRPRLRPARQP